MYRPSSDQLLMTRANGVILSWSDTNSYAILAISRVEKLCTYRVSQRVRRQLVASYTERFGVAYPLVAQMSGVGPEDLWFSLSWEIEG